MPGGWSQQSRGGQGSGSPGDMVASRFELDPVPQCLQLASMPNVQDLPAEPPRLTLRPLLRVEVGQVAEDIAGAYGSKARQEWEVAVLSDLVADARVKGAIHSVGISHAGRCTGYISLGLKQSAPRPLIDTWEREGLQAKGQLLRVGYHFQQQPPDSIRVLILNLPAPYAVCGILSTLLTCAGYSDAEGLVAQEFLGSYKAGRAVVPGIGRTDCIVAFVRPPAGDPLLCKLPDSFLFPDSPTFKVVLMVDGRKPGSLHRPVPADVWEAHRAAAGLGPLRGPPAPPPPPPGPSPASQARRLGTQEPAQLSSGLAGAAAAAVGGGVWSNPTWHASHPPALLVGPFGLGFPPGAAPMAPPATPSGPPLGVPMEIEGTPTSPSHQHVQQQPQRPGLGPAPMDQEVEAQLPLPPTPTEVRPMDCEGQASASGPPRPSQPASSGEPGPSSPRGAAGSAASAKQTKQGTPQQQQQQQPQRRGSSRLRAQPEQPGGSQEGQGEDVPEWVGRLRAAQEEGEQFKIWRQYSTLYLTAYRAVEDVVEGEPEVQAAMLSLFQDQRAAIVAEEASGRPPPTTQSELPGFVPRWIRVHLDCGSYDADPGPLPPLGQEGGRRRRQRKGKKQQQQQQQAVGGPRSRSRSRSGSRGRGGGEGPHSSPQRPVRNRRPPGPWFKASPSTGAPPEGGSS